MVWAAGVCTVLGIWALALWAACRAAPVVPDEPPLSGVVVVRVCCPQQFWPGMEVEWGRQRFTVRAVDGCVVTLREQGFWMDADDEWWGGE